MPTPHDIWERAAAGDNSDVDVTDARYLFFQTYVVLGELLALGLYRARLHEVVLERA